MKQRSSKGEQEAPSVTEKVSRELADFTAFVVNCVHRGVGRLPSAETDLLLLCEQVAKNGGLSHEHEERLLQPVLSKYGLQIFTVAAMLRENGPFGVDDAVYRTIRAFAQADFLVSLAFTQSLALALLQTGGRGEPGQPLIQDDLIRVVEDADRAAVRNLKDAVDRSLQIIVPVKAGRGAEKAKRDLATVAALQSPLLNEPGARMKAADAIRSAARSRDDTDPDNVKQNIRRQRRRQQKPPKRT
ncbi:MAG: hypothetical protein ACSLFQ_10165 [Thermoanaerobaculia bacterium]